MFMKIRFLIYLFLATVTLGCKPEKENTDFERNALLEILPSLVDSTCGDPRIFLSPPPYPLFPPKGTEISEKKKDILNKKWKRKLDSIKKDTSSIYLAFNPEIKPSDEDLDIEFEKHFKGKKTIITGIKNYTLDLSKIKLNRHFKFKHDSLFYKDYRVWMKKYNFVFAGLFEVSRIRFDKTKTYGILSTGYTCESRCGKGHLVFIKKVEGKWIIDKMKMTWIS